MKAKPIYIISGVAWSVYASIITGKAQQFQNLGFESSLGTPPISPGFYNLPDWNVATIGDQAGAPSGGVYYESPLIQYNVQAYLVSTDYSYDILPGSSGYPDYGAVPSFGPLSGNQALALFVSELYGPTSILISQSGTIPEGQNSVSFLLGFFNTASPYQSQNPLDYFSLSINNQKVPMEVASVNGPVLTVSGNISQWAGQTVSLSIAETVGTGYDNQAFGVIDDVAFSTVGVPESSWTGILAAAISLSVVYTNQRRRSENYPPAT